MKESSLKQLEELSNRYGWIPRMALKNMRLLLLVLFACLSLYLVNRVNTLVNSDGSIDTATASESAAVPASSSISKIPDTEVLTTFNELSVQEVKLDSNFESNRENPF